MGLSVTLFLLLFAYGAGRGFFGGNPSKILLRGKRHALSGTGQDACDQKDSAYFKKVSKKTMNGFILPLVRGTSGLKTGKGVTTILGLLVFRSAFPIFPSWIDINIECSFSGLCFLLPASDGWNVSGLVPWTIFGNWKESRCGRSPMPNCPIFI